MLSSCLRNYPVEIVARLTQLRWMSEAIRRHRGGIGRRRDLPASDVPHELDESNVLFCDNHMLAINKPAGLLSQGDRTEDIHAGVLARAYVKKKFFKPGQAYCSQVHRLDRPVSGVMIFALSGKACKRLAATFSEHSNSSVKKIYYAIVCGRLEGSGVSESFMMPQGGKNQRTKVLWCQTTYRKMQLNIDSYAEQDSQSTQNFDLRAKKAITEWEAIHHSDWPDIGQQTIVRIRNRTGRKHQIRAQLAYLGHPIIGDVKYGATRISQNRSIALHARILQLPHPVHSSAKSSTVTIDAPFPKSWSDLYGKIAVKKAEFDAKKMIDTLLSAVNEGRIEKMKAQIEKKLEAN